MKKQEYAKPEVKSEVIEPGTLLAKGSPPGGGGNIHPPKPQHQHGDGGNLKSSQKFSPFNMGGQSRRYRSLAHSLKMSNQSQEIMKRVQEEPINTAMADELWMELYMGQGWGWLERSER